MVTGSMEVDLPAGIQNGALVGALVVNVLDMEPAQQFSLDRNRLVQSQRLFAVENPLPVDYVAGIFRQETRPRETRSHSREGLNTMLIGEAEKSGRETGRGKR